MNCHTNALFYTESDGGHSSINTVIPNLPTWGDALRYLLPTANA